MRAGDGDRRGLAGIDHDLIAVGRGSYLNELIGLAGGENILADTTVPYPKANMEEIIRRNPDVHDSKRFARRHLGLRCVEGGV